VSDYNDLPDCETYQDGAGAGSSCVPEKGPTANSFFRAANYPVGVVDPSNPDRVVVTFGSYINRHSNEDNGCEPAGFSEDTGNPLYTGVKQAQHRRRPRRRRRRPARTAGAVGFQGGAGQSDAAAPLRTCRTASWTPPVHGSPCPGSTRPAETSSRRAREATAWAASAVKGATCGPRAPVVTA
jgi:hypothetical protein